MKKKWMIVLIISVIFLPLILSASVSASLPYRYVITDLGDLYGDGSRANGINNYGEVVGLSFVTNTSENARAFLWTEENGMVELNGLYPGSTSIAESINDLGEIAGSGTNISDQVWGWHAIFWTMDHQVIDLGKNPNYPTQSNFAHDINVHGQVVGECFGPGWIWTQSDGYQFLPGDHTYGMAINDKGEVAGGTNTFGGRRAYVWSEQLGLINLGSLAGEWSQANDINNNRWVVGSDNLPNGGSHAFFWTEETGMIDIGTLGGRSSYAIAINNSGYVVGGSEISNGIGHAFIWNAESGMLDLNDLISENTVWELTGAADINDSGQIVGAGWKGGYYRWVEGNGFGWEHVGGVRRAFLLTPVYSLNNFVTFEPDPSTYKFTPDTADCQAGAVGKFSFDATLTNISETELSNLVVDVEELTNDNLLLINNGLIGEGERFNVPKKDGFVDGLLGPSESVDVPFIVCLTEIKKFRFFVDVFGRHSGAADLSISKSDGLGFYEPLSTGDPLTYTVTVNNAGPAMAQNVVVTDPLPAGVTFVSTSGCAEDPNGVPTCSLGNIAAGGSAQYTMTVMDQGIVGEITNTASVSSDTADPDTGNNTATEKTLVSWE